MLPAALLLACASGGGGEPAGDTVILLSRHAERASNEANSDLSPAGLERARALAERVVGNGVAAVYSTDLCRTAQTAQPAARAAGQPLRILATGSPAAGLDGCAPAVDVAVEPAGGMGAGEVAATIRERDRGRTVLVVGHSNTVPALVEALTGRSPCPGLLPLDERGRCFIAESDYGDLFIVRLRATGAATAERLHYGAETSSPDAS